VRKFTIVIADDEQPVIDGLLNIYDWEQNGFMVAATALDGESAVKLALACHPDALLVDINMPKLNGLDVMKEVARHLPDTKFMVLSGYDEFSYVRGAFQLHSVDYLLKPIGRKEFAEAMNCLKIKLIEQKESDVSDRVDISDENRKTISKMVGFIEANMSQDLNLTILSEEFHMNPYYISSYFKRESGLNFSDYLNLKRINKSKELLKSTNKSINEIADETGFKSYRYFSKTFEKYSGILPSQYRKR